MDLILGAAVLAGIVIFLVALGIIFKILKSALGIVLFIIAVILLLSSASIYRDVNNFRTKFNESSNIFLLMDQEILVAGFGQAKEDFTFFDESMVAKYQRYVDRSMNEEMLGENYKIFFIDIVAFEKEDGFDALLQEKNQAEKSVKFSYMVADKLDNDIMFFFREYRDNNIEVYPRTALFKFIDFIPFNYLTTSFENIKTGITQKIESFIKNRAEGLA
jgi:hypothetical protein